MQFYEISATVLPLFLLTIFTQRRLLTLITDLRFESEQDVLLYKAVLVPADAERLRQFLSSEQASAPESTLLADTVRRVLDWGPDFARTAVRRARRWQVVSAVVITVPVLLAGVALFTCMGVLFADGAPTWVGIVLVWPGLVTSGVLLFLSLLLALFLRLDIGVSAATKRLRDKGLLETPRSVLPTDPREFDEHEAYVRRAEREMGLGEGAGFL